MKTYEEATLALIANDITVANGSYTTNQELLDEGVVGNRLCKTANAIQKGEPNFILPLGGDRVTVNDTGFRLPCHPDTYWEDGELLDPEQLVEAAAEAFDAIQELTDREKEFQEQLADQRYDFEQVEAPGFVEPFESEVGTLREVDYVRRSVKQDFRREMNQHLREGIPFNSVIQGEVMKSTDDSFDRPDTTGEDYKENWTEAELERVPDPQSWDQVSFMLEEKIDESAQETWIKTEAGRLYKVLPI